MLGQLLKPGVQLDIFFTIDNLLSLKCTLLSDKGIRCLVQEAYPYVVPKNPEIILMWFFFFTFSRLSQFSILQGCRTGVAFSKWGLMYRRPNLRKTFMSLKWKALLILLRDIFACLTVSGHSLLGFNELYICTLRSFSPEDLGSRILFIAWL